MMVVYCDYGCGQEAKYQFKNGKWCCSYNISSCPKINEKRIKLPPINKGKTYVESYGEEKANRLREEHSKIMKRKTIWNKGLTKELDERVKRNAEGVSRSHKGKKYPAYSISSRKMWENPEFRNKQVELHKKQWKDSEYVSKQMKSRNVSPNKLEMKFEEFLNNNFPNEWKYVGDGQLIISGKCPDFVNVNGKKKIIELYGNYWHKGENPEDRIKIFEPFGYQVLIIWEKELNNMKEIKNRIDVFQKE